MGCWMIFRFFYCEAEDIKSKTDSKPVKAGFAFPSIRNRESDHCAPRICTFSLRIATTRQGFAWLKYWAPVWPYVSEERSIRSFLFILFPKTNQPVLGLLLQIQNLGIEALKIALQISRKVKLAPHKKQAFFKHSVTIKACFQENTPIGYFI